MASSLIKSQRHNAGAASKNITNSLPYTCESDGYIYIYCKPIGINDAYLILAGAFIYRVNSFNGYDECQEFSVSKGEVINFSASGNCTYVIHFIPIIG